MQGAQGPTLVTLGRDAVPPTFRLTQTLDALQGLPWTAAATLSQALSTPAVAGKLVEKPENSKRLGLVRSMLTSEKSVGQFSSALKDPTLVTGPQRLSLLAVLSHNWDSNPAGWEDAAAGYLEANHAITTSVNIAESSPINLVADNGSLPIAVGNTLGHPVTVYLSVRPDRALLNVIKNHIEVTIEANSQTRVYIPVESVANGEVSLAVSLTSSTGVQVSQPMSVQVNVRADWERLFTGIIAGLVVAVFAFGIWRNLTKRRRARREAARAVRGTSVESAMSSETEPSAAPAGLGRASAMLASGTIVSRILGFIRVVVLAAAIGQASSATADAFGVANQLPNSIYALVAGGVLSAVLVPQIVRAGLHADGGQLFINRIITLGVVIFLAVTLVATLAAPALITLYAQQSIDGGRGFTPRRSAWPPRSPTGAYPRSSSTRCTACSARC